MNEKQREGAAETLRGALVIVIAGALLGLGFNALALESHPRRGLTWITREEKMPSLEELQTSPSATPDTSARGPASSLTPAFGGGGGLLVLAVCSPAPTRYVVASAADSSHARAAAHKRAAKKVTKKATGAAAKSASAAGTAAPGAKAASKPAAPAANPAPAPPSATKTTLPTVPDLDKPIEVKLGDVKKFFDAGPAAAVFIDARERSEYAEGHIKGAVNLFYDEVVAKPELIAPFKNLGKPIIAYCSGGDCELSKDLANTMIDAGIRKVLVFTDGLPAWKAAGFPIETGAAER
ncbi:MAG TPA: rhodanese-like domain-containing protein [Terriglobales bacterium]|nr:rhodanese-like domain-containing protein [Terriglobales bacterium]